MNTRHQPQPNDARQVKPAIADCDIHPVPKSMKDEIYPYLERRWQRVLDEYGAIQLIGFQDGVQYPKGQPDAARRDAYPPSGGKPGSDLDFMRAQHLDPNNVEFGVLIPLFVDQALQNTDLSIALCAAVNDWQVDHWTSRERRLKASILIAYQDAAAAVAEIERRAADPHFVQIAMLSRTQHPLGHRSYWPIFAAAERTARPIAVHAFGYGGHAITGGGWPSYYIEDVMAHAQSCQSLLASMVLEGVFERFPKLRLVLVEGGSAWLPALTWRLDSIWKKNRLELQHVPHPPSEYIREHVWLTSQPIEEPPNRKHFSETVDWIGWDRILYASDYPHWDFDNPSPALQVRVPAENREGFFKTNAMKLYGQGDD